MNTEIVTTYDYAELDTETSAFLQTTANEIRVSMRRTMEEMARVGILLLEAKARLPHGQFLPWIKSELGISQSTAWRFMQVAQGKEIKKSFTVNDVMEQISVPMPGRLPISTMRKYNDTLLSEPFREYFQVLAHAPCSFDPLLQAQEARWRYLISVGKDPETDDILQIMHEEIHSIVVKGLNREEVLV